MSLDGLRAWIGDVERKLGMRTRVFLVLATIAIGGAGASIYLALDTRDNAVSESDVRALQEELEAQIGGGSGSTGAGVAQLEAELDALRSQVEQKSGNGGSASPEGNGAGNGSSGEGKGAPGSSSEGTQGGAGNPGASAPADSKAKRDLLQQSKEASK